MAGCKPAILDSTPVPVMDTDVPEIQIPTPVCQVSETAAESDPNMDYGYPPLSDEDWVEGNPDALVTFTFYGDFLCPYSAELDVAFAKLMEEMPQDFRVVFRQLPIQQSYLPALAIEAAGMQSADSSAPLRHYLFSHQAEWFFLTGEEFLVWLHPFLKELGIDTAQFDEDILSDAAKQHILDDLNSASELQIVATPFLLINGKPYTGIRDEESLREIIAGYQQIASATVQLFDQCPDRIIDSDKPIKARIVTNRGELMVELYPQLAPFTVNNFVFLAEKGWYDDTPIFRVVPGTLLQAGDPTGTGSGTAGYLFSNEIHPDLSFDEPGMLAMANGGSLDPISNSSQFIITFTPIPEYTGGYTIFGKIIVGMDVLNSFPATEPVTGGSSEISERIVSIEILEDK
jgi:cyclophilin family peptidyl-prolyl cis-trans isomerase/protein-disulfide isomerase